MKPAGCNENSFFKAYCLKPSVLAYVPPGRAALYPSNGLQQCVFKTNRLCSLHPKVGTSATIIGRNAGCDHLGFAFTELRVSSFPFSSFSLFSVAQMLSLMYTWVGHKERKRLPTWFPKQGQAAEPTKYCGLKKTEACFHHVSNSPSHSPFISHLV